MTVSKSFRRLVIAIAMAMAVAACMDGAGVSVYVSNQTSVAVYVNATGRRFVNDDVLEPNTTTCIVFPGEERQLPFVFADFPDRGDPFSTITTYGADCELLASSTHGVGTWRVVVNPAGVAVERSEIRESELDEADIAVVDGEPACLPGS